MNIAVCEDCQTDSSALCDSLREYCDNHSYCADISVFSTGEALLRAFTPGSFTILFLDIFLPGCSGMDVAKSIRGIDRDCIIVFVTTSLDFAMEGFGVSAAGYVVKPVDREKIANVMYACRFALDRSSRIIELPISGMSVRVSVADLIYVEICNKEAVLYMKRGRLTTRFPLDQMENKLGGSPFLRCHRSFIINMNHVDDILDHDFLMCNGDVVPMRKNGRKEIKMAVAVFVAGSASEVV